MVREILQKNSPSLREKCQEVTSADFSSEKLNKEIQDMFDSLKNTPDGVALAAPQIGINKRIFVVSEKILEDESIKNVDLVYINPKIIKKSSKKTIFDEGCLSVRNVYGKIKRSSNVTIEAKDADGKAFVRGAGGLLAEIYQHEIDHLNGILFTDNAYELKEIENNELQ